MRRKLNLTFDDVLEPSVPFLPEDAIRGFFEPTSTAVGPTSGVYFVRGAGLVKIGLSRCVLRRVQLFMWVSPVALSPVGFLATPHSYRDAFRLEAEMHAKFADSWHHGEWFTETADLTEFMETSLSPWPIP